MTAYHDLSPIREAKEYSPHPATDLFPMLGAPALKKLAADIAKNGLLHAIVVFEGRLLDGRNRLAACKLADVEPRFDLLKECASPAHYVVSANLLRRQLTPAQCASLAVEAEGLYKEEAKARQRAHGGTAPGKGKTLPPKTEGVIQPEQPYRREALSRAATSFGVARTSAYAMREVKEKAPEVFAAAKRGEVKTVAAAVRLAGTSGKPPSQVTNGATSRNPLRGWVQSVRDFRTDCALLHRTAAERLAKTTVTHRAELVNELRETSKTTANLIRAINRYRTADAKGAKT